MSSEAYRSHRNFFPAITRDEATYLLEKPVYDIGTFLIRGSSRPKCLVISLKQSTKVLHILVVQRGKGYGLDPVAWPSHDIGQESFVTLDLLIHRLKQLGMLSSGLEAQELYKDEPPSSASSSQLPTSAPAIEHTVSKGKATIQKVMEQKAIDTASAAQALEHEYRGMVSVFVQAGKLTPANALGLKKWRDKHKLSEFQHHQVLKSLNVTPEEFEKLKQFDENVSAKQSCAICLDADRCAAFVACGHMATCLECAQKVTQCPICRKPKTKVIKVFT